jgi:hypothetical protein
LAIEERFLDCASRRFRAKAKARDASLGMTRGRFEVAYNERNRAAVRTERMEGEVAKDVRRTRRTAREAAQRRALRAVVFLAGLKPCPSTGNAKTLTPWRWVRCVKPRAKIGGVAVPGWCEEHAGASPRRQAAALGN